MVLSEEEFNKEKLFILVCGNVCEDVEFRTAWGLNG